LLHLSKLEVIQLFKNIGDKTVDFTIIVGSCRMESLKENSNEWNIIEHYFITIKKLD